MNYWLSVIFTVLHIMIFNMSFFYVIWYMSIEIWLLEDQIFRDGQIKNVMFEVSKVGFTFLSRSSFTSLMLKFIIGLVWWISYGRALLLVNTFHALTLFVCPGDIWLIFCLMCTGVDRLLIYLVSIRSIIWIRIFPDHFCAREDCFFTQMS